MAPDGTTVMENARYNLDYGPDIVRLNFTRTILSDNGIWNCQVLTESEQYIVSGGRLVRQDSDAIGELTVDIQLTIIGKDLNCPLTSFVSGKHPAESFFDSAYVVLGPTCCRLPSKFSFILFLWPMIVPLPQ